MRGYDPEFDYQVLLYDLRLPLGNRADPPADAGKANADGPSWWRAEITPGSKYYATIRLISQARLRRSGEGQGRQDEMQPAAIEMAKPGLNSRLKSWQYLDGGVRTSPASRHRQQYSRYADVNADGLVRERGLARRPCGGAMRASSGPYP
jgi:hypothetical protein